VRAPLIAISGVAGLLFGSFANVLIHRVPRKESIVRPRSRCPHCGHEITPIENVPVVSWLFLRGKCSSCRARISFRYPAVELLTGALFALVAWRAPRATDLVAYLPLVWVLVVLSFVDAEHKLLPNAIVLPSIAAGAALFLVAALLGPGARAYVHALEGAAIGFGFFLLLALIAPAGMGMGDVKLAALLGMALGYLGLMRIFTGFFAAFVIGSVAGLAIVAVRGGGRKTQVPFGPSLAAGTLIAILYGAQIQHLWTRA
jgi:leader peptidase (prepilin peptidase)/N-methyltransferase